MNSYILIRKRVRDSSSEKHIPTQNSEGFPHVRTQDNAILWIFVTPSCTVISVAWDIPYKIPIIRLPNLKCKNPSDNKPTKKPFGQIQARGLLSELDFTIAQRVFDVHFVHLAIPILWIVVINRSESVLLAYARKRLDQLTQELSSYQTEEQKRLESSLQIQREEDAKLTELKLKQETERMASEFETTLKKKVRQLFKDGAS